MPEPAPYTTSNTITKFLKGEELNDVQRNSLKLSLGISISSSGDVINTITDNAEDIATTLSPHLSSGGGGGGSEYLITEGAPVAYTNYVYGLTQFVGENWQDICIIVDASTAYANPTSLLGALQIRSGSTYQQFVPFAIPICVARDYEAQQYATLVRLRRLYPSNEVEVTVTPIIRDFTNPANFITALNGYYSGQIASFADYSMGDSAEGGGGGGYEGGYGAAAVDELINISVSGTSDFRIDARAVPLVFDGYNATDGFPSSLELRLNFNSNVIGPMPISAYIKTLYK